MKLIIEPKNYNVKYYAILEDLLAGNEDGLEVHGRDAVEFFGYTLDLFLDNINETEHGDGLDEMLQRILRRRISERVEAIDGTKYHKSHYWVHLILPCLPPIKISHCRDCHARLGEVTEDSICPGILIREAG